MYVSRRQALADASAQNMVAGFKTMEDTKIKAEQTKREDALLALKLAELTSGKDTKDREFKLKVFELANKAAEDIPDPATRSQFTKRYMSEFMPSTAATPTEVNREPQSVSEPMPLEEPIKQNGLEGIFDYQNKGVDPSEKLINGEVTTNAPERNPAGIEEAYAMLKPGDIVTKSQKKMNERKEMAGMYNKNINDRYKQKLSNDLASEKDKTKTDTYDKFNTAVKDQLTAFRTLGTLRVSLDSPKAADVFGVKMPKFFGDSGNMAVVEQAIWRTGDPTLYHSMMQKIHSMVSGGFTERNKDVYKNLLNDIQSVMKKDMENTAQYYSRRGASDRIGLNKDEIYKHIYPDELVRAQDNKNPKGLSPAVQRILEMKRQ